MENERDHCIRCGECCLKASPTLQMQDLVLINSHFIKKEDLYTIRKVEIVNDNINDRLQASPRELIKIREREIWFSRRSESSDPRPAGSSSRKLFRKRHWIT